jgi:hypothetical protein
MSCTLHPHLHVIKDFWNFEILKHILKFYKFLIVSVGSRLISSEFSYFWDLFGKNIFKPNPMQN